MRSWASPARRRGRRRWRRASGWACCCSELATASICSSSEPRSPVDIVVLAVCPGIFFGVTSFGPAFPIERRVPLRAPFHNRHWNAPAPLCAVAVPKDSQAQCDHLREAFDARESRRRSAKIIVLHRGMNTNILVLASSLSDPDLLARVAVLAGKEREATAELLAHLAELDTRPALFAAQG